MKSIPGPPEPFWRQLQEIRRDFLGFILRAGHAYGDLVRLRPGPGATVVLVNHPSLIQDVLVNCHELFHKTEMTRKMVGKYLGNGLILSEDAFHRRQRRLAQPAFHRKRVTAYSEVMTRLAQRQLESWRDKQVIDFEAEMTELTMFVVAKTLFNVRVDGGNQERDELVTIFFAGHETTAKLLTWSVYLLTQHPEVAQTVRHELDGVLNGRLPTVSDLPQLIYLDQMLKETLRLYPPAWLFDRMPIQDVELGGYRLNKGTTLYLSPYVSHRDPRYFDAPGEFRPERFAAGWEKRLPRFAYYPFGGGPRICIGQSFAELDAKIVLATLLPQIRFALQPNQNIMPEPAATLRPQNGLRVQVQKR